MNNFLLLPLSSVRGVGPSTEKYLKKLLGSNRVIDLLFHIPMRIENVLFCPRLFEVESGKLIITKLKAESHVKPGNVRQPYKIICYSPTGYVNLIFFKIFPNQIEKLKVGNEIAVLGYLEKSGQENKIVHPIDFVSIAQIDLLPKISKIYPLSLGVTQKFLNKKITEILSKINFDNYEWIDKRMLENQGWKGFTASLKNIHETAKSLDNFSTNLARRRLGYDELLAFQIAVNLIKKTQKLKNSFSNFDEKLYQKFLSLIPFCLTNAQLRAIDEIRSDICSTKKMFRLLQGDVGSGKTIIALFSCFLAHHQKKQSCIICPTTILAKQHFAYIRSILKDENINIEILTSATTKKEKSKIISNLESGKTNILVSTHAALEDDIKFQNLGIAIIDEQHRFGVEQRMKLVEKGKDVDVLLMSATPIPRSLMMALYGDMDISILDEKPKNRQKIETLVISESKIENVYESIKRAISKGEKIYWVCPAIEENEENDLVSVNEKYQKIIEIFDEKTVGLIHGKMKEKEKDSVMNEFAKDGGKLQILICTSVIEVGIDVPSATIVIIENSQNFGLSQLHQLRGRVGRGEKKSFCILLYSKKIGPNGKQRLGILRSCDDGFEIAQEDLKMRGSGELLGKMQSGFPQFKIADLNFDSDLLQIANIAAKEIVAHQISAEISYLLKVFGYYDFLNKKTLC